MKTVRGPCQPWLHLRTTRALWIPNTCASVSPSPQWGWGGQIPALREVYPQHKQACLLNLTEEFGEKMILNKCRRLQWRARAGNEAALCLQGPVASPQLITRSVCCHLGSGPWSRQGTRVAKGQVSTDRGLNLGSGREAHPTRAHSQIFMPWTRPCPAPGAGWLRWLPGQRGWDRPALPQMAAGQCWLLGWGTHWGPAVTAAPPRPPSLLFLPVTTFGEHIFRCQAASEKRKYFI